MRNLKSLLFLFALATTVSLASCQSEPVEPQAVKKTTQAQPTLANDDDADRPPKDRDSGGH